MVCAHVNVSKTNPSVIFHQHSVEMSQSVWSKWDRKPKEICCDQAYTSDGPTASLVLWISHLITMLQWVPLPWAGLCLCLSVCKPDWPRWMRILQTGWHVVYRPVLPPFTRWFSAHISEDSSSSMAPGDVLWQGMRERAAKWIQGWAKRSFQRRLQREERREGGDT